MVVDFDAARVLPEQIQKSVSGTGLKCEPWLDSAERDQTLERRRAVSRHDLARAHVGRFSHGSPGA
jgi:hypothetical protein